MKITTLLLFVTMFQIQANTYSQKTKISLNLKDVTVGEVLNEIESLTEFKFFVNTKQIDLKRIVSIVEKKQRVSVILKKLFSKTNVSYEVFNKQIILKPLQEKAIKATPVVVKINNLIQDQVEITGTVTDENGEALPGVNIIVVGTTKGTQTDFDGNYTISASKEDVLQFSFIGMLSQEIAIGDNSTINVSLKASQDQLDEVVVVGYGSVKKKDLTGSVSQIKASEISAFPSADVVQSLQGRASGVIIQSNNGEPGGSLKVRIRGATSINASSDPLYVVDGFPGAELPASEDIVSVQVLKDASSTAIYGSRGSNGVIIITTKRGKPGETKIEFNASASFQKETSRLDLLNAEQYITLNNEVNPGSSVSNGIDTDWQEEIFQPGLTQNYQLSFSGGTDNVNYYVSGVYYDQEGIVINSNFKRYSLTSNLNIKASEKLDFGINLMLRRSDKDGIRSQESGGGLGSGVIGSAVTTEPTLPVFDEDGNYSISTSGDPIDNAVAIARERKDENISDLVQANFFGTYKILEGLTFRMNFGVNTNNSRRGIYNPTTLLSGAGVGGSGSIEGRKFTSLLNENYFTYTKSIENHDFTVMGGYSYQTTSSEFWQTSGQSLLTDSGFWWGLSGASVANPLPRSRLEETVLSSFYGRVNYKLFDRYLLTVNARYDGSSRFAKNNKWAFFPSAAIAWNMKEESFLADNDLISQLKLRASYGITGSQSISPYQSLATLSSVLSIQNSNIVNAVRPTGVANDDLTWESTTQSDFGIELGFLNQRITLVADLYKKITDDLIFAQPLPQHSGYSSFLNNIGSVENKGLDLTLSTVNTEGDFRWTTDFNFSRNRNEILELPEGNDIRISSAPGHMVGTESTSILREGEPVGSFYGFVYDGVYQQGETILPGNFDQFVGGEKFKDLNGDGKINADDRTIIGNPHPDFFWGLNNDFQYKNFDLNIFFVGSQGNDIYSFTLMELETLRGISNSTTEALNRWTPTNTITNVPVANAARGYHSSSRWIFDGSYIRLRNIALGYTFPESIGFAKLRVYMSAQNILTFTDYRGFDPEVNYQSSGGSRGNLNVGLDYASYPNQKSFTVGLNITF